jgi:GNAT superfamily N-acetyltransferase
MNRTAGPRVLLNFGPHGRRQLSQTLCLLIHMNITQATLSDIPALCELLAVLFSQEAEFSPDPEAQRRGLEQIVRHPEIGHILVAREDGQVLAMLSLLYTVSTALGARVALLEDMVVSPDARGSGVGSRLLEYAVQFARTHGCERITLLTDRDNESAQHFYQKHGISISPMIPLRLSVREPGLTPDPVAHESPSSK